MKIDFSQHLRAFDGREIVISKDGEDIATLGWVAVEALMHPPKPDAPISAAEMIERHKIAIAIHDAREPLDMTIEQAALLKRLIPVRFPVPALAAPALLAFEAI